MVSLLIGVNNQYRGQELDRYRIELQELLSMARDFAGGEPDRLLVLSIPDWGQSPFAEGRDRQRIAEEINAFNAVGEQEARRSGALWVDITGLSREATAAEFTADGLHYSSMHYRKWAELAAEHMSRSEAFGWEGLPPSEGREGH
jgi:hypothetical protein